MTIREIASDPGHARMAVAAEEVAANRFEIGVQTRREFVDGVDPLPGECRDQSQKDRLFLEQAAKAAGPHVRHVLVVKCGRSLRSGRRRFGRHSVARGGEALIERWHAEVGQLVQEHPAEVRTPCFGEAVAD